MLMDVVPCKTLLENHENERSGSTSHPLSKRLGV